MPKFQVQTPTGQIFEVDAPDGATQEDAIAYIAESWKPDTSAGGGRGKVNPPQGTPPSDESVITRIANWMKPEPSSVLDRVDLSTIPTPDDTASRLAYGAGPVSRETVAKADAVNNGTATSTDRTVNRVAKSMASGDTVSSKKLMKGLDDPIRGAAIQQFARDNKAEEFRTLGEHAVDLVSGVSQGAVSVPEMVLAIAAPSSNVAQFFRDTGDSLRDAESDVLKAQRERMADRIRREDGFLDKYTTTVQELVTNPALGMSEAAKQVPNFLAILGLAKTGMKAAGAGMTLAEKVSPSLALGEAISGGAIRTAVQAGGATAGGLAGSVALTAGDAAQSTYQELTNFKDPQMMAAWQENPDYQKLVADGMRPTDAIKELATAKARMSALITAPLGLFGFMGAEASMVSRGAAKALLQVATPKGAAKTFFKEIAGENIEEGGTQLGSNAVVRGVDKSKNLMDQVPEAMATATVTSGPFAALGAYNEAKGATEKAPVSPIIDRAARARLDAQNFDPRIVDPRQTVKSTAPKVEEQPTTPVAPTVNQPAPATGLTGILQREGLITPVEGQQPAQPAADAGEGAGYAQPTQVAPTNAVERIQLPQATTKGAVPRVDMSAVVPKQEAAPAPAETGTPDVLPATGNLGEQVVEQTKERKRKHGDLSDSAVYSDRALYGIVNNPQAGEELRTAATEEINRRNDAKVAELGPRPASVSRGIEIAKAGIKRQLLPSEQQHLAALEQQLPAKDFELIQRIASNDQGVTPTQSEGLLQRNEAQMAAWDKATVGLAPAKSKTPQPYQAWTPVAGKMSTMSPAAQALKARIDGGLNANTTTASTGLAAAPSQDNQPTTSGRNPTNVPKQNGNDGPAEPTGAFALGSAQTTDATRRQPLKLAKTAPVKVLSWFKRVFDKEFGTDVSPYTGTLGERQQVASALAAVQGKTLTFLTDKTGNGKSFADGLAHGLGGNHIAINADRTQDAVTLVTLHEILHTLPPELRARFVDAVWKQLLENGELNAAANDFLNKFDYTNDDVYEELPAFVAQIIGKKQSFWEGLRDKLGEGDFRSIVTHMLKALKAYVTGTQDAYGAAFVKKYLHDITELEGILQDVLVENSKRVAAAEAQSQAEPEAVFAQKASAEEEAKADSYAEQNGIRPYTSQGQIEIPLDVETAPMFSLKTVSKDDRYDPVFGLPVNKNGTVTLYYPTTNEESRRVSRERTLRAAPGQSRVYLTNESSAPKVSGNPGGIEQEMDGANVLVQIDPALLHLDQEHADGRKDFFIPVREGKAFQGKMKQVKLFTQNAPRTKALSKNTKLTALEASVGAAIEQYSKMNAAERRARLKQAKVNLKEQHNVGTLLGVNGKLEKTNLGGYGVNDYNGQDVMSMGLGLASAQRINEQNLSTCPKSAICESLCLGETSGQNLLYGGDGQYKSGPRLSQYLKTEAMVQSTEDFAIVLYAEIARFRNKAAKGEYQATVRLNVTSDFRPQVFAGIINAFPDVMFYDYTKLPTKSIAANHHLTYSSTGASQMVNGKAVVNKESNWDKMVEVLRRGDNVAMAFSDKNDMPAYIIDEKTGEKFQVWNGDNYDARFLDPKPGKPGNEFGKGMIIGLTNKDRTGRPEDAAERHNGFFLDYSKARDGDTLVIEDQEMLATGRKTIPIQAAEPEVMFSRKQTETPEFKKWFGDSKVVDADGKPLVVYHGTREPFAVFDYGRIGSQGRAEGAGFYFTNNQQVASGYGKPMECFLSIQKPLAYDAKGFSTPVVQKIVKRVAELEAQATGNEIADGFLSNFGDARSEGLPAVIRNAAEMIAADETAVDQLSGIVGSGVNPEYVNTATRDVTGFDGIVADGFSNSGDKENRIFVAFFREQIKSATGNNGEFDGSNPDIRFSRKAQDTRNLDQDITLEIPVEGGGTAKLTVNAQTYLKQLDAREDALRMVKECML